MRGLSNAPIQWRQRLCHLSAEALQRSRSLVPKRDPLCGRGRGRVGSWEWETAQDPLLQGPPNSLQGAPPAHFEEGEAEAPKDWDTSQLGKPAGGALGHTDLGSNVPAHTAVPQFPHLWG